jgi:hypothetical protein
MGESKSCRESPALYIPVWDFMLQLSPTSITISLRWQEMLTFLHWYGRYACYRNESCPHQTKENGNWSQKKSVIYGGFAYYSKVL